MKKLALFTICLLAVITVWGGSCIRFDPIPQYRHGEPMWEQMWAVPEVHAWTRSDSRDLRNLLRLKRGLDRMEKGPFPERHHSPHYGHGGGCFIGTVLGSDVKNPAYVPGELLVKYKASVRAAAADFYLNLYNIRTIKILKPIGVHHVKLPEGMTVEEALLIYQDDPDVVYAEPNYYYHLNVAPNDPYFDRLWGLHNRGQTGGTTDADIDAPEAWAITTGSSNVIIAVIDTGVNFSHPDLSPNIWTNTAELNGKIGVDDDNNGYVDDLFGWDFYSNDNFPTDPHGHGTHVAGTIAAKGDNSIGVTGVSWTAKIMVLRFLGPWGGSTSGAIHAIEYANANGAHIINNSWGGGPNSTPLHDAICASSAVVVCAAGNGGLDGIGDDNDVYPYYPSSYDCANIISVAATDHNDKLASYSNHGVNSVDVAAPGSCIQSTAPGGGYQYMNGTSMAAPHVSGTAALIKAKSPTFTNAKIKKAIMDNVDTKAGLSGKLVTGGRINAFKSLPAPAPPPVTPPPTGGGGGGSSGCFIGSIQ